MCQWKYQARQIRSTSAAAGKWPSKSEAQTPKSDRNPRAERTGLKKKEPAFGRLLVMRSLTPSPRRSEE
jgi:hypothetical protein